jgi:cytochrome c-type biogenesis protein CcmH
VLVSIEPKFAGRVSPDMPVFIYAREEGGKGPPLAVVRRRVADLPLTVALDDSQSMLPDRKLSSVDRWIITARVARQGSAETRSGDVIAEVTVRREQLGKPVPLLINRSIP